MVNFTNEEKDQIIKNIAQINEWLTERRNLIRDEISINLPHEMYILTFNFSKSYLSLGVGRGSYYFIEDEENVDFRKSLFNKSNSMYSFFIIDNWIKIKDTINKEIEKQNKNVKTIMEFTI